MNLLEHIQVLAVSVLLTALGVLMVVRPEWLWKLEHWLDTVGGEPSEWYLTISRVVGTLLMIFCGLLTLVLLVTLLLRLLG